MVNPVDAVGSVGTSGEATAKLRCRQCLENIRTAAG